MKLINKSYKIDMALNNTIWSKGWREHGGVPEQMMQKYKNPAPVFDVGTTVTRAIMELVKNK